MNVHTIKVSYTRSKQPKDYESASPTVELSASIEDGVDHLSATASLMFDACSVVYGAIAMDVPDGVAEKLGNLEVSDVGEVEEEVSAAKEYVAASAGIPALVSPPKAVTAQVATGKKRGRPAKVKEAPASVVKTTAPAEPASKLVVSGAVLDNTRKDVDSDIPDETAPVAAKTAAVTTVASDVPDETTVKAATTPKATPAQTTLTHQDVQGHITKLVQAKKVSVVNVKEVLNDFGAARVSEIPVDKLGDAMAKLNEKVELAAMAA